MADKETARLQAYSGRLIDAAWDFLVMLGDSRQEMLIDQLGGFGIRISPDKSYWPRDEFLKLKQRLREMRRLHVFRDRPYDTDEVAKAKGVDPHRYNKIAAERWDEWDRTLKAAKRRTPRARPSTTTNRPQS